MVLGMVGRSGQHTRAAVFYHCTNSNVAADSEEQADDYAESDAGFADLALALAAIAERRACAVLVRITLRGRLIRRLFPRRQAVGVPHGHRYRCCEPEQREEGIDGRYCPNVVQPPGAGPHGHHDLVEDGGDCDEALRGVSVGGEAVICTNIPERSSSRPELHRRRPWS